MQMTAHDLLESARQLPQEGRQSLLLGLLEEEAQWRGELGEPEQRYSDWVFGRVRKSLEDVTPGISTEEAMSRARAAIRKDAGMKQTA